MDLLGFGGIFDADFVLRVTYRRGALERWRVEEA